MSGSDSDFESASENTRLMDAHVATTGTTNTTDVSDSQNRRRKPRSSPRTSGNNVNYGSVREYKHSSSHVQF